MARGVPGRLCGAMFDTSSLSMALIRGSVLSAATLVLIVAIVRIIGVRALSKMTAFDFVITLASGSLLATAGTAETPAAFAQAIAALTALLALQYGLAWGRSMFRPLRQVIDNRPLVVMRDGEMDEAGLRGSRMSRDDVASRLRQAGIADPAAVSLFVLEATGDISIVTNGPVHADLLASVRESGGTDGDRPR
ncbi:MAG: DUF421 domain-containing protein [Sphingomonas hengshuiensis]|uniref:DUF421 domain-containing protein n=2 Tax=Sphingomonas TaxID=13687 RepID=A0A2W4Z1F0_9SPHN|nr:MAG: DUF421 domain-containing protein [Sphingomonas hengshuiensis]